MLSNADVDTLQVSLEMSFFSHDGRYLKNRVEEEKRVKPVSLGEEVAPWNSWNLFAQLVAESYCQKPYLLGRGRDRLLISVFICLLNNLEQTIIVERHGLCRQDIVQASSILSSILDFEQKPKLPG